MKYYIPVLEYTDGSVEVFTGKFGGTRFANMGQAKLYVAANPCWECASPEVALMRARDKTQNTLHYDNTDVRTATPAYITQ
jgi:hypothetical protein